jgi:hypoxanthine phosphoribosyltransferase
MTKVYMSQRDANDAISKLSSQLFGSSHKFSHVVGVANGGLVISNFIAYAWDKTHLIYDPKNILMHNWTNEKVLLVDDIVDSGDTLRKFKRKTKLVQGKDFWVATLHWCPENSGDEKPDFYVLKKKKSHWIVYPWEDPNEVIS